MRLIKKQDQIDTQVKTLSFSEEPEAAVLPAVPSWMESAVTQKSIASRQPAVDPAHIEKAAYENGFRQGEKAGLEIAEKKIEAMMRRYTDTILEIGKLKPRLYAQVEQDVVKLALEVAKKVVHREVQIDREIIQTLIKVALSHVAVKSPVTIHLHPVDCNFVLEQRAASMQPGQSDREMVLLADKSIQRGGCLIETECGEIDARIEEEFREVQRAFFSGGE